MANTEYVGNWRGEFIANAVTTDGGKTATVPLVASIGRKGTGTLATATYNYKISYSISGSGGSGSGGDIVSSSKSLSKEGWTSSNQSRQIWSGNHTITMLTTARTVTYSAKFQYKTSSTTSNWYTASINVTIPAIPTHTITLNNQSATSAGSTAVYAWYEQGIYKEAAHTNKITTSANAITIPTKTGYTFGGYYTGTNGSGTQMITAGGYLTSSFTTTYYKTAATLYAKWTAQTSSVTLNQQNGTGGTTSVTATYNAAMPAITKPTRTGYIFNGYYDATSGGTQYYTAAGASARTWNKTGSQTLYARWTAQTSSVTLNMNGGSGGTASVTATYDAAMPAITKPTLSGWTFQGYYDTSAASGGTQYYTAAGASARAWNKTGSQTLYARWSRSVTFKHGKSNAYSNAVTQYKGGNVTPPSITTISGWTALGWRDDTTAGAQEYGANNTTAFAYTGTATTLYATYSRTLTLSYTNGGGSGTAPTATTATQYYNANGTTSSASFTLRANTFTAPTDVGGGWAFSKWGAGNANAAWSWNPGVDTGASTSTAAVWTRTVTFKSGVNSTTPKAATQTRGSAVAVPSGTVTPSGWTFLGWRADTTASTASYTGSSFSPSVTTVYAVFSRTLTLSYTNGGGTGTAPSNTTATQYYNSGNKISTASFTLRANTFTRAGYYFSKWGAGNANATWSWTPAVDAAVSTSTAAQWTSYYVTLRYNVNGGSVTTGTGTTRWRALNGRLQQSTNSGTTWVDVTHNIYTYNVAGDSTTNMWNVSTPPILKTGYYVIGTEAWNTKTDGTGIALNQDYSTSSTTNAVTAYRLNGNKDLTANITVDVYPKWIPSTYTVTLNKNGGSGGTDSVTATYNSAMPAASMPTRTGYTFNGYYDATSGGTQYYTAAGASTRAWNKTSNTTLYAQWTERTATLTYNNSGLSNSTVPSAVTMKYTTATTLTAGTAPSGYGFNGWATSDANAKAGTRAYTGTQQYKAANVVPSAATLYAIWCGTVTYNANGHGTAPTVTTMYYTLQPKAAGAISATGYTFNGWNTKADGTGTNYTAGSTVLKNANEYKASYTLYAKWTVNTYTITFDRNGGTGGSATATATYDAAMPAITKPTRAGYKFEGYYDASSGGTQYYTATGASARTWNKTASTTLYAHWSATSSFVSGDYRFTILSTGKVRAEAADKTKTTYAAIPTTVADPENSGGILKVTSIDNCFNGCNNLTGDIFVSHNSGELESYDNVFSTTKPIYILATSSSVDHNIWQTVANQKSNINYLSTDSDYSYIVNPSTHKYSIKVLNTTKTSYSNPKSTLSSATTWTADSMAGCFQGCNKLTTSPTIPNTITNMSNCFSGCTALVTSPTIPNTVTNMNSCFLSCNSLQHVPTIPANVTTMVSCFQNCGNLRGNIVVNNKTVTSSNIFANAGSTQNQIYIINGLGSDSTLASTWRAIAGTNANVHYEIDDLNLSNATFTAVRQIYSDNSTNVITGYAGGYIKSAFSLLLANIKNLPIGWTINWSSTSPVEKMGNTSIGNTITTTKDSSQLYFNNVVHFLINNNDITVVNYYTVVSTDNRTFEINRTYGATLADKNKLIANADYKDSDYIYTIINNSSTPKQVAAYAFNRTKTAYSNIPSTITINGVSYTVTSLYFPSYNINGTLNTSTYIGGCFEGCTSLISFPSIPSTITDIRNCFKNCSNLSGNIIVNNNPSNYSNLFTGAGTSVTQDIYIINGGKQEIPAFWRNIANSYNKVHFEGDDNPAPSISSLLINRGIYSETSNTWDEDDTGNWIKLNIYYTLQTSKLPFGWVNQLVKEYYVIFNDEIWDSRPIFVGDETQIVYMQPQSKTLKTTTNYYTKSGNTYTLVTSPTQANLNANKYWIKGYKGNIVLYFKAINQNEEEINYQTNVKISLTDYLDHEGVKVEIIYAMFAMLDFLPGGHGMAIGQASFQEGLVINLPTLIGEELIPPYRTNTLIPTQDHLVVEGKSYYNATGTIISSPLDSDVEEYYEKVSAIDLNQRQLVLGKYNIPDYTEANAQNYNFAYLLIGNGTDKNNRSNLFRVDATGITVDQGIKFRKTDSIYTNLQVGTPTANRTITLPNKSGTIALTSDVGVTSVAITGSNGITISNSPITSTGTITVGLNLSTAINGLSEGTASAQLDDYAVVQYAGGGTTTTTYHRRKLGNLIVGKAVADQNGYNINDSYISLGKNTTALANNTDLNSVITPGNYRAVNGTVAKSLTNCPIDTWFIMRVGYADGVSDNWEYQEIIQGNNGARYYRQHGGGTWTAWHSYLSTSNYLPLAGGIMTGDLLFSDSGTTTRQIRGIVGSNDYWRVAGGATAGNAGWMEIATADDGNEPIYARQYTGAYTTIKRTLTLLDADGNTTLPGRLYLTSPISYKGTQATYDMIKFKDNTADIYGNGIIIGGGGLVVVGAGESADSVAASYNAGAETTIIAADSNVEIATGVQDGYTHTNTKKFDFNTSGDLHIPRYGYAAYLNQSSGTETPSDSSNWMFTNSDGFLRKSTRQNLESHIYPYEAKLQWGGQNYAGNSGPLDAALVPELGANRFAFAKAAGITVEYSRDTGSTWTDYGLSNTQKTALFSSGVNVAIGKADSTNKATANGAKYQLRVTLSTNPADIYTEIKKFAIYVTTNGSNSCTVTIQTALESTPTTFVNVATDIPLSGWSGWNIINVTPFTTYGNTTTTQNGRVRFIFKANGGNTNYLGLNVIKIQAYGGVGWTTPSYMALNGHLYTYDADQNATFPAQITATQFNGKATQVRDSNNGTAITITYGKAGQSSTSWLASWNGYELGSISASKFAPAYQYSTTDLTAGSSALTTGTLYFVYV